jgi:hypothetical protein
VFRGADAVRRGLLTEHQLRSRAWARLRQDVYADARLARDHALACQGTTLRLPPGAVIAGRSAAYLLGIEHAATFTDDVHVIAPTTVRVSAQRGVRVHVTDLLPGDVVCDAEVPHTTATRTACDIAAWAPTVEAVAVLDAMTRRRLLDPAGLPGLLQQHIRRRGSRRAALAFALVDSGSRTPFESALRVRLVQAGVPRPVLQHPVPVAAGLILQPDLAWPAYRVAIEYQTHHLALLAAAGWLVVHVPAQRIDFAQVLREVRQALARRGWHRPSARPGP